MDIEKKEEILKVVVFELEDNEEMGVAVQEVLEVVKTDTINAIPNSPEYILGFTNLRGKVIPVIDLLKKLNIEKTKEQTSKEYSLIIVDAGNSKVFGVVVRKGLDVISIEKSQIQKAPEVATAKMGENIVTGIALINKKTTKKEQSSIWKSEIKTEEKTDVEIEKRSILIVNLKNIFIKN
ncbi:chemotaxis protein CheW [Patescibacteria group bacterium]|nr:chemotaxis protein CheW [Patescibacteria group bacterium]